MVTQLHSDLYIPFAGPRYYRDASVYNMGRYAGLWSSSPYSAPGPFSRSLDLNVDGYLGMSTSSRANSISVRCFYDKYETYEVDTTPPAKPEIGCPDYDEVLQCVTHN